jgi:hypothetical protein
MSEALVVCGRRQALLVRRFSMSIGLDSEWRFKSTERCAGFLISWRIEWRRSRALKRRAVAAAAGREWEPIEPARQLPEARIVRSG